VAEAALEGFQRDLGTVWAAGDGVDLDDARLEKAACDVGQRKLPRAALL
jgi:hypothetical protein